MKTFRVLAWLWVATLLVAGGAGGFMMTRVGWSLAMGLAIYAGDTEPIRPDLPYPWGLYALTVLMGLVGLVWMLVRHRRGARGPAPSGLAAAMPLMVAYAGGVLAAFLPFVQLFRLWSLVS